MNFEIAESGNHFVCTAPFSGSKYHLTPHSCPGCSRIIWICTCSSFKFRIVQNGGDPFHTPCVHIVELVEVVGADQLRQVTGD